jgi:hypothetical protein
MPSKVATLELNADFTHVEFSRIANGLVPERMEDRWFIYLDDDTLQVHRTGTGVCIYQVVFGLGENGVRVKQARVNRDKNQYPANNDEYDVQQLRGLLDKLAQGRVSERPKRPPFSLLGG